MRRREGAIRPAPPARDPQRGNPVETSQPADRSGSASYARTQRLLSLLSPRALVLLAVLLLAVVVGFRYLKPPAAIETPTSDARSVTVGPNVWAAGGGDEAATRTTSAVPPLDGKSLWETDLEARIVTPLVSDGAAIFVALEDSRVLALSAADGHELWSVAVPGQLDHPPTIAGDTLYAGTRAGHVVALHATTGALRWSFDTGKIAASSPIVVNGVVWAGAQGEVVALDAETGGLLGQGELGNLFALSPPVLGEGIVVVATRRGTVQRGAWFARQPGIVIVDRRTAAIRFHAPLADVRHVGAGRGAVVAVSGGAMVAFDPRSRSPWWEGLRSVWAQFRAWGLGPSPPGPPFLWAQRLTCDPLAPVVHLGQLVLACSEGVVRGYDLADGAVRWEHETPPVVAPPVMAATGLLVLHADAIRVLDPASGLQRSVHPLGLSDATDFLITSDRLYVVAASRRILAIAR